MSEAGPTTQTVTVADARERWSEVIAAVSRLHERIILEEDGIPVAALVSADDLDRLRRYDAEREADFAVIDRMREAFKDVPDDELEREVARAVSEAREELRVETERVSRSG